MLCAPNLVPYSYLPNGKVGAWVLNSNPPDHHHIVLYSPPRRYSWVVNYHTHETYPVVLYYSVLLQIVHQQWVILVPKDDIDDWLIFVRVDLPMHVSYVEYYCYYYYSVQQGIEFVIFVVLVHLLELNHFLCRHNFVRS